MSPYASRNRAFTLIELLIVITIIGILAVALIPRLTGGPARARDAQRKADLQQIATALEFYNTDNNTYPSNATNCVSALVLSTSYISSVPNDPSGNTFTTVPTNWCSDGKYTYVALNTDADGTVEGYILAANLENDADRGQGTFKSAFAIPAAGGTSMPSAATMLAPTATQYCYNDTSHCATSGLDIYYIIGR